jgi:hypothetical protein
MVRPVIEAANNACGWPFGEQAIGAAGVTTCFSPVKTGGTGRVGLPLAGHLRAGDGRPKTLGPPDQACPPPGVSATNRRSSAADLLQVQQIVMNDSTNRCCPAHASGGLDPGNSSVPPIPPALSTHIGRPGFASRSEVPVSARRRSRAEGAQRSPYCWCHAWIWR